jgi:hypothetical protein
MDPRARLHALAASWHPPGELQRSRPRESRLRASGIVLIVLAALLAAGGVASGVLLYAKASADHAARTRVIESGHDAEGRILRRFTTGSGDDRRYLVQYEYLAGEHVYEGRLQLRRRAWQQLEPESTLPVRYLPSEPASHIVVGRERRLMPLWLPPIVGAGLLLGAWLVTRPLASQRLLFAEGRPAPAIVTRQEKTKNGAMVHFVFQLLSGATAEGKAALAKPPALESVLCILYLPDRKWRYGIYPLSLVKTARDAPREPLANPAPKPRSER